MQGKARQYMRPAGRVSRIHFFNGHRTLRCSEEGRVRGKRWAEVYQDDSHHRYPKDVSVWIGCEEDVSRVTKDQNA